MNPNDPDDSIAIFPQHFRDSMRARSLTVVDRLDGKLLVVADRISEFKTVRHLSLLIPIQQLTPYDFLRTLATCTQITSLQLRVIDPDLLFGNDDYDHWPQLLATLPMLTSLHLIGVDHPADFFGGPRVRDLSLLVVLEELQLCWSLTLDELRSVLSLPRLQLLGCKSIPNLTNTPGFWTEPGFMRGSPLTTLRCEQLSADAMSMMWNAGVRLLDLHLAGQPLTRHNGLFDHIGDITSLTNLAMCSCDLDNSDLEQLFRPDMLFAIRREERPLAQLRSLTLADNPRVTSVPLQVLRHCTGLTALSLAGTGCRSVLDLPRPLPGLQHLDLSRTAISVDLHLLLAFGHVPDLRSDPSEDAMTLLFEASSVLRQPDRIAAVVQQIMGLLKGASCFSPSNKFSTETVCSCRNELLQASIVNVHLFDDNYFFWSSCIKQVLGK